MANQNTPTGPGKIVKTSSGFRGRTYNHQNLRYGKVQVYLLNDKGGFAKSPTNQILKMLIKPENITVVGYCD